MNKRKIGHGWISHEFDIFFRAHKINKVFEPYFLATNSYLEVRIFGHRWISDEFDTFSLDPTALEWALQVGYHWELEWLVMCSPQNSHKCLHGLRIRLFHLYYLR